MDIRIGADPAPLVRNERRDPVRDESPREASPGVIVEIGRQPIESAGTYSARGVLEGTQVPPPKTGVAPPPGTPVTPDRVRVETPPPTITLSPSPEALRMPANAQVQVLANASPQLAAQLRAGLPLAAAHLHPPPQALTAGVQPLAATALKQTERSHATQEHDEETDPLRKDREEPVRDSGKRRGR